MRRPVYHWQDCLKHCLRHSRGGASQYCLLSTCWQKRHVMYAFLLRGLYMTCPQTYYICLTQYCNVCTYFTGRFLMCRLTLGRRLCRAWRRVKRWCFSVLSALLSMPKAVLRWIVSLGSKQRSGPRSVSSPVPENVVALRAATTDRPILTGVIAAVDHQHVD